MRICRSWKLGGWHCGRGGGGPPPFLSFSPTGHLRPIREVSEGFSGGSVVKNSPANSGDTSSVLGL